VTLLIGTISNTNIVITADGLSLANPTTGDSIKSNTFQKIFPLPGIPVAIAHHGFNILDGHPVNEFLRQFMTNPKTDFTALSIHEIAIELFKFTDPAAQVIFTNPANSGGIGFWIAGFLTKNLKPLLYEIHWPNKPKPEQHELIVLGGEGRRFVKHHMKEFELIKAKAEKLRRYSVEDALRLHGVIYEDAEEKQKKERQNIFGGHQHQLVIEKDGWRWIKPPQDLKQD
jgi:hypothetical protein